MHIKYETNGYFIDIEIYSVHDATLRIECLKPISSFFYRCLCRRHRRHPRRRLSI